jgi:hypothetical protein
MGKGSDHRHQRHHYGSAVSKEHDKTRIEIEESGSVSTAETITYIGLADPNTPTSDDCWRVFRVRESGSLTSVTYASGTDAFEHVWDDRKSLTYLSGSA